MANRHLSRSIVMQSLFEWDFNNFDVTKIDQIIDRNINEFAPGIEDTKFVRTLAEGVVKKQKQLDKIIEKAAPDWPIGQIALVDRNVLRLGLYELLFGNKKEVPAKVAINEAIELAKSFGGDSSGKFVNGVLGTVYKEVGGEEAIRKEMPIEKLVGAVVYTKRDNEILLALVHDVFGFWTLSKGHVEENETVEDAAKRELKEEIGVNIEIEKELGSNEYIASDPEKGKIKKQVVYYLALTKDQELKLKETGGLDNVKWFKLLDLVDLKMYDDMRPIITKAVKMLIKK